jgi:protocatechuate 3,4-dioxygenase beta subunit
MVLAPAVVAAQGRGVGQSGAGGRGQRPPRDAARAVERTGTSSVSGRVVAADTSRPLKRARVLAAISGGGRARSVTTDEAGRFLITALPAGTYTITASKTGFVNAAFGQRRVAREGTPIQLADGQQLANVNLALARGAVIAGQVLDEDGEPLARAMVQVLRYQYVRGEKRLTPSGGDQSDDRGQYRVYGLPPGEYVVSATAGAMDGPMRRVMPNAPPAAIRFDDTAESTGYAPTYYPGVMTAADAARVKVTPAQELIGIDFQLQLVPLATVRGMTTDPRGMVSLVPEDGATGPVRMQNLRAPVEPDGTFTIANVPPGKYIAVSRSEGAVGPATFAMQPVLVAGDDIAITLAPVKGSRLGGTITFEASAATPPKALGGFRVTLQPAGAALVLPRMGRPAHVDETGHFALTDVIPGQYVIQAAGTRLWTLKSVYLDGRDVTDQPVDVKGGESADALNIIFTDRISGVSGLVQREGDAPATDVRVIAFPADDKLWRPQTRRIQTARTDQTGAYRMNNLPPGDYLLVATGDVEPGEWFDPAFLDSARDKGVRLTIGEGEQKVQNLKTS